MHGCFACVSVNPVYAVSEEQKTVSITLDWSQTAVSHHMHGVGTQTRHPEEQPALVTTGPSLQPLSFLMVGYQGSPFTPHWVAPQHTG